MLKEMLHIIRADDPSEFAIPESDLVQGRVTRL